MSGELKSDVVCSAVVKVCATEVAIGLESLVVVLKVHVASIVSSGNSVPVEVTLPIMEEVLVVEVTAV